MSKKSKTQPRALEIIKAINKQMGEGTIVLASEAKALEISRVPVESLSLTLEMGGGVPENRIILISGPESSAKTALAYKMMGAILQKYLHMENKIGLWVDAEGAHENEWALKLMGDPQLLERMYVVRPFTAQKGLDVVDAIVRSGDCVAVVMDSIEALVPEEEVESSFEDQQIGIKARVMNKFFRKIVNASGYDNLTDDDPIHTTIIALNQERLKVGAYGNPKTLPGGEGQKFAASVRIELWRGGWLTEKVGGQDSIIGQEVKFKIAKNKTFAPNRSGSFDFYFEDGQALPFKAGQIDRLKEVAFYSIYYDIIRQAGAWYYIDFLGEAGKFHGSERMLEFLRTEPEVIAEIERQLLNIVTKRKAN